MDNDTPFECVVNLIGGLLVYFAFAAVQLVIGAIILQLF